MSGAFTKKYLDLYHRLRGLSTIDLEDPDSCWTWNSTLRGRTNTYPRINLRIEGEHRQLSAHRVSLIVAEILEAGEDWDLLWPLYLFYSIAGFEADHNCNNPKCVNSSHLTWRTREEHLELTLGRRKAKTRDKP